MEKFNIKARLTTGRTMEIYNVINVETSKNDIIQIRYLLSKHGDPALIYIPLSSLEVLYVNPVVYHPKDQTDESNTPVVETETHL